MIGLKLGPKIDSVALIGSLREEGLLTVPAAENVIRLLPPLIVEESHVDKAMAALDDVFSEAP
jgi:acetylornithine/N-succinyldiaminopimelate aminotransferase